jgi:uncharacterized OB-fold protein
MEESFLLPVLDDPDTLPFWEGAARGELLVQHCGSCGVARMPPRPMCPHCRSMETVWEPVSGRGTVWSYVIPHPPLLPAYTAFAPYNVIVVALEENPGLRLIGNLVERADAALNSIDPHSIVIGEPVSVVFHQIEDVTFPRWVRAG